MVAMTESKRDVVLFSPTESLILQLARWARHHRDVVLRLVSSGVDEGIGKALAASAFSIVDATDRPREAMAILDRGVERFGPGRIAVYTEAMAEGLEVFTRTRGAALLLGPVEPEAWEALFGVLHSDAEPLSSHR